MFIVTNRVIAPRKTGFDQLGKKPNAEGPLELRLVEVTGGPGAWQVQVLPDRLSADEKRSMGLPVGKTAWASARVAHELGRRVDDTGRHLLFFVHGYNNDVEAVAERSHLLATRYGVEVVAFSWPANGGGTGVAEYLSDKQDAAVSAGALNRALVKAKSYLHARWAAQEADIAARAMARHPHDGERRHQLVARLSEQACPLKVSLMVHSMGNYVLKKMLQSSTSTGLAGLFDNVVLVAADTNVEDHAEWVDRIDCRGRVFVCINEDDVALRASRMKGGELQKARLGHSTTGLDARHAVYVDFTRAADVGSSHAYFEGDPVADPQRATHRFFREAFQGRRAEQVPGLAYDPRTRLFTVP